MFCGFGVFFFHFLSLMNSLENGQLAQCGINVSFKVNIYVRVIFIQTLYSFCFFWFLKCSQVPAVPQCENSIAQTLFETL